MLATAPERAPATAGWPAMNAVFDLSTVVTYLEVIVVNVVLSSDNVVVIGPRRRRASPRFAAASHCRGHRHRRGGTRRVRRVHDAASRDPGLMLAGGLVLLWICWRMFNELRENDRNRAVEAAGGSRPSRQAGKEKGLRQAIAQIALADISMSLDNVLAIAGTASGNLPALVFGLVLSVALMGLAAAQLARLLERHHWIGWLGLLLIVYVAASMTWQGLGEGDRPGYPFRGLKASSLSISR